MQGSLTLLGSGLLVPALVLLGLGMAGAVWAYGRGSGRPGARVALALRLLALVLVAAFLAEPAWVTDEPRPGANDFVVLVDGSRSLSVREAGGKRTRGDAVAELVAPSSRWLEAVGGRFRVRRYVFDERVRRVQDFAGLRFEGAASRLGAAVRALADRYRGAPLAGILIVSDGNATDLRETDLHLEGLPPIYAVPVGEAKPPTDVAIAQIKVTTSAFEDAPVTIEAAVEATGHKGAALNAELLDEAGRPVESQTLKPASDDEVLTARFRPRPEKTGLAFYRVRVASPDPAREGTAANNQRFVLVDRGRGPYRVLYVAGRPNWEFAFMRRGLDGDKEVELLALIRMAHREPKFVFVGRTGESSNPLFRGFGRDDVDTERYDEPVLVRLGTRDAGELREGFPKAPETLFEYHGLILDDLEARFLTADQQALVERFVNERGGGLMMLGGQESFRDGGYDRTPIGSILPVYLDKVREPSPAPAVRLLLTRAGWLEPWARLRTTESAERQRLDAMPEFRVVNRAHGLKPGAVALMEASSARGASYPALAVQRAGHGRVAALTVGDLWRWGLKRPPDAPDDLGRFWRQTVRWLVADTPGRIQVRVEPATDESGGLDVRARVRDRAYRPWADAEVRVALKGPAGGEPLVPEPSADEPGLFVTRVRPAAAGGYRLNATAARAGTVEAQAEAGLVHDPDADEHRTLRPNRALLAALASRTGGRLVEPADLDRFAAGLRDLRAPVTDRRTKPLWHSWPLFALALACLLAEWAWRRTRGFA